MLHEPTDVRDHALIGVLPDSDRERAGKATADQLDALDAGLKVDAEEAAMRAAALRLVDDWRGLLSKHVGVARQGQRKLLDRERFVFDARSKGDARYYELAVRPSLEKFFGAVPTLKRAVRPHRESLGRWGYRRSLPVRGDFAAA
jgi:hypothetical protein